MEEHFMVGVSGFVAACDKMEVEHCGASQTWANRATGVRSGGCQAVSLGDAHRLLFFGFRVRASGVSFKVSGAMGGLSCAASLSEVFRKNPSEGQA
jgi:hypothetical protein